MLSVQPRYDYRDGKAPTLVGYDLANVVEVTVRDLATLGDVVDGALTRRRHEPGRAVVPASTIPARPERARTDGRGRAARARAEVLAEAAGRRDRGRRRHRRGRPPPTYPRAKAERMLAGGRRRDAGLGRDHRDRRHGHGDVPDRLTVDAPSDRSVSLPRGRSSSPDRQVDQVDGAVWRPGRSS